MIRNYRDIGKPASILMYTGAGQSQNNGGTTIREGLLSFEIELEVNGVVYQSDASYIDAAFMSLVMSNTYMYGGTGVFNLMKTVSMLSSEFDTRLDVAFDSVQNIDISQFQLIGGTLFQTVLEKSGTITSGGVIKSIGVDATTNKPNAVIPALSVPKRRMTRSVSFAGEAPSNRFVYNPFTKRLISMGRIYNSIYSGRCDYIDYDAETGVLGTNFQNVSFPPISVSSCITGDGLNFLAVLYKQNANSRQCTSEIGYFDFNTLTYTRIFLTHPVPADPGAYWDVDKELIISRQLIIGTYYDFEAGQTVERQFNGFTVDLEGNVTLDTGWGFYYPVPALIGSSSLIYTPGGNLYSTDDVEGAIATSTNSIDRRDFITDVNGDILTAEIDNINAPTQITFTAFRLPDSAKALCRLPEISVNVGDPYRLRLKMKMLDRRLSD